MNVFIFILSTRVQWYSVKRTKNLCKISEGKKPTNKKFKNKISNEYDKNIKIYVKNKETCQRK